MPHRSPIQRSPWRITLAAFIVLLTGCSAQATVSVDPTLSPTEEVEAAAEGASTADDDPDEAADPAASGQATAAASQSNDDVDLDGAWDRQLKAERQSEYDDFRRELHSIFHTQDYPLEEETLPDQAMLQQSLTGDTARTNAVITFVDPATPPMTVNGAANGTTGLTWSQVDRVQYRSFLADRWIERFPALSDPVPGMVETIRQPDRASWSRGLTPGIARTAYAPLDVDRWYTGEAIAGLVRSDLATTSAADLWNVRLRETEPLPVDLADGTVQRSAALVEPTSTVILGYALSNPDRVPVTLTTVSERDGTLLEIVVEFDGDRLTDSAVITFTDRGEPLSLPAVSAVVQNPRTAMPNIDPDFYAWTGSGRFRDAKGTAGEGPWVARGAVGTGIYPKSSLSMTVGDVAILGQLPSYSAPADQLLIRYGYESVAYATGMIPELVPSWASVNVEADALYIHDPYNVPADLFTAGLGDEAQWAALRTVPEIVQIQEWDYARVTSGQIDPDYWNYRHGLVDGFFAWLMSEGPDEVFDVTIGADADGRMLRFRLVTTDPDGGGLTWDIDIEHGVDAVIRQPNDRQASHLSTNQQYVDQVTTASARFEAGDFDAFFDDSRAAYPTSDHAVTPDHLTVILKPSQLDDAVPALRWDYDVFTSGLQSFLGQRGTFLACLDADQLPWRFDVNGLEELWRIVAEGSSLDAVLVQPSRGQAYEVDIYATDGDRHVDDPCEWNPQG